MEEVIRFVENNAGRRPNQPTMPMIGPGQLLGRARNVNYSICNELGSLYLINQNGSMTRKANVQSHPDFRMNRHGALRLLTEMQNSQERLLTINIHDQAVLHLMYCHRPVVSVNSNCSKILILGRSQLIFGDWNLERQDCPVHPIKDNLNDSNRSGCLRRVPAPLDNNCHEFMNKDQLDLYGNGSFYVRVSSNKHRVYIATLEMFQHYVTYTSNSLESRKKLADVIDNLPRNAITNNTHIN